MIKHHCSWASAAGEWLVERVCSANGLRRSVVAALLVTTGAIALVFTPCRIAMGQLVNVPWVPTGTDDYAVGGNWGTNLIPSSSFSEIAVIDNGGTAFVASELSPDAFNAPGGVILGQAETDSGTLEVRSGGSIVVDANAEASPTATPGTTVVGQAGLGTLRILRGATLVSDGALTVGGSANSLLQLGETGGAGTATLDVNAASNLNRTTHIIGPNVSYTTNSLTLGAEHNLIAQITGAAHSPIQSTGSAALNGALTVDLDGHTPAPGDTWDIIDAASISGSFSSFTTNAEVTEPGYEFFVETASGGANGRVLQVLVDTRIQLSVDRGTGAASLTNLTTSHTFDIDGYLITSAANQLTPGGWDSFQQSGVADWEEANPMPNSLSEVNLSGSRMIGPGQSAEIGNVFAPGELGTPADLVFSYNVAGEGPQVGVIEYTGPQNNLVLVVDPETGQAALQNQSPHDIDIDGYQILSNAASLNPNDWASLSDGGMAGWEEANPTANSITELNFDGSTLLAGRSAAIDLGTIFDTNAERDLVLHYNMAGVGPMVGIVDYGEVPDMPMGIPGDYNDSGLVEQGDLDLVLGFWGADANDVPATWTNDLPEGFVDQAELDKVLGNWGAQAPSLAVAGGVPEPSGIMLVIAAVAVAALGRMRRRV